MTRLFARWPLPVAVVLALLLQGALAAPCAAHGWNGHISKTKTVTVTTTTTKTCGTIAPVAVQPVAPVYAPAAYAPAPVAPVAAYYYMQQPAPVRARRPDGSCSADGPSQLFLALRPCPDGRAALQPFAPTAFAPAPQPMAYAPAPQPMAFAPAGLRSSGAPTGSLRPGGSSTRRAGCLCPCGLCPGPRGPGGSRCTSTSCAASPDTTGLGPALGLQDPSSKEMVPSIAWNDAALP